MENQSGVKEKSLLKVTVKIFIRLSVCIYLGLYLVYLLYLALVINSFLPVFMFIIGTQFIIGPILLCIALGAYFVRLCDLSQVPKDTTLYECITSPTIQYGPIKLINPVIPEGLIDDERDSLHK